MSNEDLIKEMAERAKQVLLDLISEHTDILTVTETGVRVAGDEDYDPRWPMVIVERVYRRVGMEQVLTGQVRYVFQDASEHKRRFTERRSDLTLQDDKLAEMQLCIDQMADQARRNKRMMIERSQRTERVEQARDEIEKKWKPLLSANGWHMSVWKTWACIDEEEDVWDYVLDMQIRWTTRDPDMLEAMLLGMIMKGMLQEEPDAAQEG